MPTWPKKLSTLFTEFARRVGDFEVQKHYFKLFHDSFAAVVEISPVHFHMELIELQCNQTLKANYENVGPAKFPCFIRETVAMFTCTTFLNQIKNLRDWKFRIHCVHGR